MRKRATARKTNAGFADAMSSAGGNPKPPIPHSSNSPFRTGHRTSNSKSRSKPRTQQNPPMRLLPGNSRKSLSTPNASSFSTPTRRPRKNSPKSSTTEPDRNRATEPQNTGIRPSALRLTTRTRTATFRINRKCPISTEHCEICCDSSHPRHLHSRKYRKPWHTVLFFTPSSP